MFNLLHNITWAYLLYIFYGVIFFFLGVAIAAKNMRGSDLQLAGNLWLLGTFGFLHGAHEWLELGPLIEGEHLSYQQIFTIRTASVLLGVLSFMFLLRFGVSLLRVFGDKRTQWARASQGLLFLIWLVYIWLVYLLTDGFHGTMHFLYEVDRGGRFTFGLVGGLMTSYGLIAHSRELSTLSRPVSKKLFYAGIAFGFYALFAGLFFHGSILSFTSVPVEAIRGITAFFITYFITKALNIFDIETRIKYDQQARSIIQIEKLTSLGRLAAGVAHEINNPLTNASLGIQTLKDRVTSSCTDAALVERLDAVERNIDKASAIAAELLQFAREKEPAFVMMNIHDAIDTALSLLKYRMQNIIILKDFASVSPIYGDPGQLERVFINILSNSAEAMPEGGEISIRTAEARGCVVIHVSDNGAGIAKEHLLKVFDPFFTTKEIGKGTGLGLAICYGIIRQHQGTIELESAAGAGTSITIKLPAKERYEKDPHRG